MSNIEREQPEEDLFVGIHNEEFKEYLVDVMDNTTQFPGVEGEYNLSATLEFVVQKYFPRTTARRNLMSSINMLISKGFLQTEVVHYNNNRNSAALCDRESLILGAGVVFAIRGINSLSSLGTATEKRLERTVELFGDNPRATVVNDFLEKVRSKEVSLGKKKALLTPFEEEEGRKRVEGQTNSIIPPESPVYQEMTVGALRRMVREAVGKIDPKNLYTNYFVTSAQLGIDDNVRKLVALITHVEQDKLEHYKPKDDVYSLGDLVEQVRYVLGRMDKFNQDRREKLGSDVREVTLAHFYKAIQEDSRFKK